MQRAAQQAVQRAVQWAVQWAVKRAEQQARHGQRQEVHVSRAGRRSHLRLQSDGASRGQRQQGQEGEPPLLCRPQSVSDAGAQPCVDGRRDREPLC